MSRKLTISLTVIAVVVLVLAVLVEPALAKEAKSSIDVEDTGTKLGELIRNIFTPVVFTIAGVIGVAAIVKRDYLLAISLLGVTIIVLGFLMPNTPYLSGGEEIIKSVFGIGGATIGALL